MVIRTSHQDHYHTHLQALVEVSLALQTHLPVQEVLQVATKAARDIIGAHLSVASLTLDTTWTQAVQHISRSKKYAAWQHDNTSLKDSGLYAVVCGENRSVRLTQAELEAHLSWREGDKEGRECPPLRGWLATPLVGRKGHNLGIIQVSDRDEGEFTAADEAVMILLAGMVSAALEHAQLAEQLGAARQRLGELSRRLAEVQEAERKKLTRALHDEVSQLLTVLKFSLDLATSTPFDSIGEYLRTAQTSVSDLIATVRQLSLDLHPSLLDDLGLLPALLWHIERYTSQTGVRVNFIQSGLEGWRFRAAIETAAYRIVQEALTNTAQHARVHEVTVQIWVRNDALSIQIEDAGIGFDRQCLQTSALFGGLADIQEQAAGLGGYLTISTAPGAGTRITVALPLGDHAKGSLNASDSPPCG